MDFARSQLLPILNALFSPPEGSGRGSGRSTQSFAALVRLNSPATGLGWAPEAAPSIQPAICPCLHPALWLPPTQARSERLSD